MKNVITHIALIICILGLVVISNAQETRVSGTLKVHPWINLPVVESTDVKGGMQSLGIRNLTATPATVLDALVPSFDRTGGMLVSVIDADNSNRTRYFEFTGTAWIEVSLIYYWEAAHAYAIGDYVVYQGNYYVANAAFTSHATTFTNDATKWNNAGGKDGKYTVSELKMDGQTLSKVAPSGATVDPADINKTLATVGFVNAVNVGGGLTFNVDRPVTLSGTNVSTRIDFVGGIRGLGELKKRVDNGSMKVAFALYPVSMQQLINIADSGNIMPPKTTWFEPKLRSGLVIHKLD